MNTQELASKIQSKIETVINGGASQYFTFEHHITEETWKVRVSNHGANNSRVDENTLSFVVNLPETEDEENLGMKVSKKSFSSFKNQFMLDENGEFEEEFGSIEECLEWILF